MRRRRPAGETLEELKKRRARDESWDLTSWCNELAYAYTWSDDESERPLWNLPPLVRFRAIYRILQQWLVHYVDESGLSPTEVTSSFTGWGGFGFGAVSGPYDEVERCWNDEHYPLYRPFWAIAAAELESYRIEKEEARL